MPSRTKIRAPAKNLEEELLRLFARQSRRVPIAVIFAAAMIVIMAEPWVPVSLWGPWLLLVVVVVALRWFALDYLARRSDQPEQARLRIAVGLSAIAGITHALSLVFFPALPEFERAIQSMLLVGLCAASVATMVGFMPVFLSYILPIMIPLSLLWAYSPGIKDPGRIEYMTAGVIALYAATIMMFARDAFRLFRESFEIRLQHLGLNRQLESALLQAEAANRAKTRFLASASHDLRQPMHTLSLFGAALAMRPLDPRSRDIAEHMNEALQVLASQLDALLDISKLDAGIVRVNKTALPLQSFLKRIGNEFAPVAATKGLHILIECPADTLVETDLMLLERIIRNLFDNAIKYTDFGVIGAKVTDEAGKTVLLISDTGRGIAEAEQPRVFEEFYQVDNPERDRTRGLGLGLAIVKRLADLLGIRIQLASKPGNGTSISLWLPKAREDAVVADALEPVAVSVSDMHVLVVDDENAVRHGMKTLLEAMGCSVALADGTAQAVQQAKEKQPDIVLADIRLRGDDDGIASVRAIRALYPDVAAILISGDTAPDRLRDAEAAGVVLLHKPVPINVLKQAIFDARSK